MEVWKAVLWVKSVPYKGYQGQNSGKVLSS